jgi:DME family drug/metabolite transporter
VLARAQLLLGALLFSTGGVAIKLSTLGGWQVAGLRAGIAALVLSLALPKARRLANWRVWLVACPYAATFVLYTLANKQTTAANTIFLQDTAPLYLLVLSPLLLRERIKRADVALLAAMAAGAALLFTAGADPVATAPNPRLGDTLALTAGATWALCLLGLRWIASRPASGAEPLAVIVAGCLLALAVGSLAEWPQPIYPSAEWTPANWAAVTYLGVVQIGLAYVLVTRGLAEVPALEASLLLLAEPVLAPVWAWLSLGETPRTTAVVGGIVILAAIAANVLIRGVSSATRRTRSI